MYRLYLPIFINLAILSLLVLNARGTAQNVPFYLRKLPGNFRKVVVEEISFGVCPGEASKNSTAQNNARLHAVNTPQNNQLLALPDKFMEKRWKDGLNRGEHKLPKFKLHKPGQLKENKGKRRRRKRFTINYECPKDKNVVKADTFDHFGDEGIKHTVDNEVLGQEGQKFGKVGSSKIVGGETASTSWPWLVSVQYLGLDLAWHHFCGGSLIQTHWVVTAAHCISHIENYFIRVVLGDYQLGKFSHREQVLEPDRIFMHKYYNESSYHFDIALIKLQTDARITRYVDTIDVATEQEVGLLDSNDECYIAGWGNMIGTISEMFLSDVLQYSRMWVLSDQQCESMVTGLMFESQLCISSDEASACKGDSGGPLVCRTGNDWTLIGAASYICSPTCEPMKPNIYTRIPYYVYWMASVIQQYDSELMHTFQNN